MHWQAIIVAAALILVPLDARSADLVVWWEKGYYAEEDEAIAEIVAAFEHETGKQVELVLEQQDQLPTRLEEALAAGQPPDVAFGLWLYTYVPKWASEGVIVDLSKAIGPSVNMLDPDQLDRASWQDPESGHKALYGLPIGRSANHIHVWKSLLEEAGFTLADIPREWEAFWSFWCDEVQPAVRQAPGRDDIWGAGLPMSVEATDTWMQFLHFAAANQANYVTSEGQLVIDDPTIRANLVQAVEDYASIYLRGCTPPDSVDWGDAGNNERFLDQTVVMTTNETLSVPNALRSERPDDYYDNVATIEWPIGRDGEPFPIGGTVFSAVVFEEGANLATAEDFVGFLVGKGWLAHYLNFSGERLLPSIAKLLEQPFWLDPSDPHRMASVMQVSSRSLAHNYAAASGNWRHDLVEQENVWGTAIDRVATEGISPEQAVDEAIARIKEILNE